MMRGRQLAGFLAVVTVCLTALACGQAPGTASGSRAPVYRFAPEERAGKVTFRGYVDADEVEEITAHQDTWVAKIVWVAPEGSIVASGDVVARLEMKEHEDTLRGARENQNSQRFALLEHQLRTPKVLAEETDAIHRRELAFQAGQDDRRRLFAGKLFDERQQRETDLAKASVSRDHARSILEAQQKMVEKGFDSPFSRRQQEIEVLARTVEVDYSSRQVAKLQAGPLPEELAKADHTLEIASGELWLAQAKYRSEEVSRDISLKQFEFQLELTQSTIRQHTDVLKQVEIRASRPGLVIYPIMYGDRKPAPGSEIWAGLAFLRVVSTSSLKIECAVDETVSSLLQTGATVSLTLDSQPGGALPGNLAFVGKSAKRQASFGRNRQQSNFKKFPVFVKFQGSTATGSVPIAFGGKATVEVVLKTKRGVFLPIDVLRDAQGSPTVRLVERWGVSTFVVQIEPFDADVVQWLNPPGDTGEVLY